MTIKRFCTWKLFHVIVWWAKSTSIVDKDEDYVYQKQTYVTSKRQKTRSSKMKMNFCSQATRTYFLLCHVSFLFYSWEKLHQILKVMIRSLHSKDMKVLDPKLFPLTSKNKKEDRFSSDWHKTNNQTHLLKILLRRYLSNFSSCLHDCWCHIMLLRLEYNLFYIQSNKTKLFAVI